MLEAEQQPLADGAPPEAKYSERLARARKSKPHTSDRLAQNNSQQQVARPAPAPAQAPPPQAPPLQNALADLLGEAVVTTVDGPPPSHPQAEARSPARSPARGNGTAASPDDRMRLLEEKRLQLEEKKKRLVELKAKRNSATAEATPAVGSLEVQAEARVEEQAATASTVPVDAPFDLDFDLDFDEAPAAAKAPAPSPDKKKRSERRSERRAAPVPPPPPVDEFEDEVATIEIGSAAAVHGSAADDEFEQEGWAAPQLLQPPQRPPQAYGSQQRGSQPQPTASSHDEAKTQGVGAAAVGVASAGAEIDEALSPASRVKVAEATERAAKPRPTGAETAAAVDEAGEAAAGEAAGEAAAAAAADSDREAQQAAVRGAEVRAEEARRLAEAERGASLREEMRQSLRAVQQGAVANGGEDGAAVAEGGEGLGAQRAAPLMKSAREKADENYAAARNNIEAIAEGDEEEEEEQLGEGEGATAQSAEEAAAAAAAAERAAERAAAERAAAARVAKAAKLDAQFEAATSAADQSRLTVKEQRKAGKTRIFYPEAKNALLNRELGAELEGIVRCDWGEAPDPHPDPILT